MRPKIRGSKGVAVVVRDVHAMIKPFGGSKRGADYLVRKRRISVPELERRVTIIKSANIRIGAIRPLGISREKFEEYVKRKSSQGVGGLLPKQREVYGYLLWRGVSREKALKLASVRVTRLGLYLPRERILREKLDKAKYGIHRLPEEFLPLVIHLSPSRLREFLKSVVLPKIADVNAARILGVALPSLKKMQHVHGVLSPKTILEKTEFMIASGVIPKERYLRHNSLEELKKMLPSMEKLNPSLQKWLLDKIMGAKKEGLSESQRAALLNELKQIKVWKS